MIAKFIHILEEDLQNFMFKPSREVTHKIRDHQTSSESKSEMLQHPQPSTRNIIQTSQGVPVNAWKSSIPDRNVRKVRLPSTPSASESWQHKLVFTQTEQSVSQSRQRNHQMRKSPDEPPMRTCQTQNTMQFSCRSRPQPVNYQQILLKSSEKPLLHTRWLRNLLQPERTLQKFCVSMIPSYHPSDNCRYTTNCS